MFLLAGKNEVTSIPMCAQRSFNMQVISSRVRTSCTETQVIKVTASPVSLSLSLWRSASSSTLQASSPLAPLVAHFTPPLLLRGGRVGGERASKRRRRRRGGSSRSSKRWGGGEVWKERGGGGGKRGGESLCLSCHHWSEVGLEGGDGSPWPPIRLPVASALYKHSLVPLA